MKKIFIIFLILINIDVLGQIKTVNLTRNKGGKKIKQVYKCYTGKDNEIILLRNKANLVAVPPELNCNGSAELISETESVG